MTRAFDDDVEFQERMAEHYPVHG
ncbi:host-nuclease inhibitor Gam family protein [Escherichia coli]